MKLRIVAVTALAVALAACSSPSYVISTKSGNMLVSSEKPKLDEKTGLYSYTDSDGKQVMIPKDQVMQVLEK